MLTDLFPFQVISPYIDAAQTQQQALNAAWAAYQANVSAWPVQSEFLTALAPQPLPPGIHWTRTSGSTWRVTVQR